MSTVELDKAGYNGLTEHTEGLPADAYFDQRQYERELQRIWYRNWVYVGRSSDVSAARAFRTFELGDQKVLLVRDDQGALQGFHNTCRHRGAALCREAEGTLRSASIVCPYHAWVYSLQGDLLRTSSRAHASGFDTADYPLYKIRVREWNGFIFVALTDQPPPFEKLFDLPLDRLDAWPLGELVVGHVLLKTVHSNWKIFWENYNECLHCPTVHPALSSLVPIYRRGIMEQRDDPDWRSRSDDPDPAVQGGLRAGAGTWSADGRTLGHEFPALTDQERRAGYHFVTNLPSHYLVAHVDYVRSSRLLPLGPEETEIEVEWLFARETLDDAKADIRTVCDFSAQVLAEDAAACEINQRGLRSAPHAQGMLMPEEYDLYRLHEWLRAQLAS
jgi:glycine betaine catabolism A